MAQITCWVDANLATGDHDGSSEANAYASLALAEAGMQTTYTDLAGDSNDILFRLKATAGTADITTTQIYGWTTDSDSDIKVVVESAYRAGAASWDDSKYQLSITVDNGMDIYEDYVTVDGLQIEVTENVAARNVVATDAITATNNLIKISNCRLRGNGSGAVALNGIYSAATTENVTCWNTIIENTGAAARAIRFQGAVGNFYNCLAYAAYAGFYEGAGALNCYNCVSLNNDDDFEGTPTVISHCASDDNDTTDATNIAETGGGADWTGDFVDGSAGDWTLLTGSGLKGTGTQFNSIFTTDMNGLTRGPTWDVGPDQFADTTAAGGGLSIPLVMAHFRRLRS